MTRIRSAALVFAFALATASVPVPASAQATVKPENAPKIPAGAPAAAPKAKVPFPYDGTPGNLLTKLLQSRSEDPLRFLAGDMKNIVGDLGAYKTDKPVQVKEEKVVSELDVLIKALEKACKSGGGGGGNPTRPLGRSILARGPGGQGDMIDPKQGDKQWASLPAKQREQILQSQTEGFPPGYERILQSYYQRLSEEKLNAETAVPAASRSGPREQPATAPQ
jgi:hypothetical protein